MASQKEVALVMGASRGMGRQIAITLAEAGYHVVVAAKTTSNAFDSSFPPDANSPQSTISTVAREITEMGFSSTALVVNTRSESSIATLFSQIRSTLGRLDVLVYNPGAIWWASVADTPFKRYKLMQEVNVEGLYASIQHALPLFAERNWRGRVVVVSPPIYSRFFRGKTAYAMGKVAMSVLTKGLAMDWVREGRSDMAVTSLWPAVSIESAATQSGQRATPELRKELRKPTVFADAVLEVLRTPAAEVNGLLDTDEDFLRSRGISDFGKYALVEGSTPRRIMPEVFPDLTVREQDDEGRRVNSAALLKERGSKL